MWLLTYHFILSVKFTVQNFPSPQSEYLFLWPCLCVLLLDIIPCHWNLYFLEISFTSTLVSPKELFISKNRFFFNRKRTIFHTVIIQYFPFFSLVRWILWIRFFLSFFLSFVHNLSDSLFSRFSVHLFLILLPPAARWHRSTTRFAYESSLTTSSSERA